MVNGTPALQLVASKPPSAQPAAPDLSIEATIGELTAAAAKAVSAAMLEFHATGMMTPAIKEDGSLRIAELAQLQLDSGLDNFSDIARKEGLRQLRSYPDAGLCRIPGANARLPEIAIDGVLEIAGRAVALERAMRLSDPDLSL